MVQKLPKGVEKVAEKVLYVLSERCGCKSTTLVTMQEPTCVLLKWVLGLLLSDTRSTHLDNNQSKSKIAQICFSISA